MPKGVYIRTEYHKERISDAHKGMKKPWVKGRPVGYKASAEARRNMSLGMKGRVSPNKGKKFTKEHRDNLSKSHIGKIVSAETRLKLSIGRRGRKLNLSDEQIEKKRVVNTGARNPNWRGGTTPEEKRARRTVEYVVWRKAVFERDNYTCVLCRVRGEKGLGKRVVLNADHIKPFSVFIELRLEVSNGRTLCVECHRKTDTYGCNKKTDIKSKIKELC